MTDLNAIAAKLGAVYDSPSASLLDTVHRIAERTEEWQAEEREKQQALAWCRANGNPHLREPNE